jgi:hypothetical protein
MNQLIRFSLILTVICLALFLFVQNNDFGGKIVKELNAEEESIEHEGDDEEEEANVFIVNGYKALQLDEETVVASGIVSEQVERIFFKPETMAYAEVIDVAPLVSLKTEYEAALAQQNILFNDLSNHNKTLKRAEALHKAKSLSARELDKIRADRNIKSSQLSAINTHLASIKYKVKSLWGKKIAGYIYEGEKRSEFDLLASHKVRLVLVSLPKNRTLEHQQQNVFVNNVNQRESALPVNYLEQASHVNNPLYGESFLYLLESQKIRTGMKLFAWIEERSEDIGGLFIPESAVIWYANEPWIYIKQDEALFIRKPLGDAIKVVNGWLLEDEHIVSDDLVVTRGGQTLLSEEFKWAIPDEEDD